MILVRHIPNALTCLNLLFGCLAIIEVFNGKLEHVIYYTFLSGIADFLDGLAARLLNVQSNIGKDLDSLADVVSFGVVPSLLMFQLINNSSHIQMLSYGGLTVAIFSGLRLAKFNNDTRQHEHFHGLPVPANALFLCPLPILIDQGVFSDVLTNPYFLLAISATTSLLLVSDFKLLALKFKGLGFKGNELRYLLIVGSLAAFTTFQWLALPFIVVFYLLTSIFALVLESNK